MPAPGLRGRLSLMMATVYAVQGAFWPLLAVHLQDLGITGRARGWIFATLAISSFITPVVVGQLADRRFAAQRILAVIYAVGTALLLLLGSSAVRGPVALFVLFLAYWLLTAPAFALATTIALRNLGSPAAEFGRVRLWGTIGWMAIGWVVALVMLLRGNGAHDAFYVAAALSAALSLFSLTLPHTPPLARHRGAGVNPFSGVSEVVRRPTMGVLLLVAFCVALTTPFVYQVVPTYLRSLGLQRAWVAPAMSLGQLLEIVALLGLTRFLGVAGFRGVMLFGLGAWVVYYGLMASRPPLWLAVAGHPIQGLAIACFHIASVMYIDTQAPLQARAGAQGLYAMVTSGLGSLCGSVIAGEVVGAAGAVTPSVFVLPALINLAMFAGLLLAFRPRACQAAQPEPEAPPTGPLAGPRPPARRKRRRQAAALS